MNDRPSDSTADARQTDEHVADTLLARALRRARWTILWERLWPALATLATAIGLFLALSWAGLWIVLPPLARAACLVIFGLLTLVAAILDRHEAQWLKKSMADGSVSLRVKSLRQQLLEIWLDEKLDAEQRAKAREGLDDVQLVMQLYILN